MPELVETESAALDLARRYGEAVSAELAERLGTDVALRDPAVTRVEAKAARGEYVGAFAHTRCTATGEPSGELHVVVPNPDALTLASLAMGEDSARAAQRRGEDLGDEALSAYGEVIGLAAGRLGALLEATSGVPAFDVGDTSAVADSGAEDWLADGAYLQLRFVLAVKGFEAGRLDWLVPEAMGAAWLAAGAGPTGEASPAEESGTPPAGAEPSGSHEAHDGERTVVFLEPDADERARLEGLDEPLGATIWALDPDEFGPDTLDALAETSLVVIAWDLHGRPGLDVLEWLHGDDRTRHLPLVLSSDRPTRALLRAGLRGGARSFVTRPYAAEELTARLRPLLDGAPQGTPSE